MNDANQEPQDEFVNSETGVGEIVDNDPLGIEDNDEAESGVHDIEETVSSVAQETMVGDLRDVCLQIIRNPNLAGKAWKDMNEAQQRDVAEQITARVVDAVVKSVQIIAANGQRQIIGTLEQVTNKDGMKSVIKTSAHDDLRHELNDSVGSCVAIVLTGAENYIGVGEKVKIDKDQPELLEGEEDELMNTAKEFVISSGKASTSSLQRYLQVGYNRAARIIEQLEKDGVISAVDELGRRTILTPHETTEDEGHEEATDHNPDTGEIEADGNVSDEPEVAALDQESAEYT